jgi:flagellar basal-body rod modification protein FlgD
MNIQGITPSISAPQEAHAASTPTTSSTSGSSSSINTIGTSSTSLQDTFLNLLVTELQNQDPTSPVDPTQMVGQMVSLNQLDQLISINQTLSSLAPSSTASSGTQSSGTSPLVAQTAGSAAAATPSSPQVAGANTSSQQQPSYVPTVDPSALMNLYGSAGTASTN